MTREEAKRLLPIIKAYTEGKTIQLKCDRDGEWEDLKGDFLAALAPSAYRIKPEAKCRPFKSAEECWQEMLKHQPFGWVKDRKNGEYINIDKVVPLKEGKKEHVCIYFNKDTPPSVQKPQLSQLPLLSLTMLITHTFIDGHPFGIKEGEG